MGLLGADPAPVAAAAAVTGAGDLAASASARISAADGGCSDPPAVRDACAIAAAEAGAPTLGAPLAALRGPFEAEAAAAAVAEAGAWTSPGVRLGVAGWPGLAGSPGVAGWPGAPGWPGDAD
jgi:pilus assembly protein FimV